MEEQGKGSVSFKRLATGSSTMLQRVYEQHKLHLIYFFFLGGKGRQMAQGLGLAGHGRNVK